MTGERLRLIAVLVGMGAGWGLCVPLGKLAVSQGYQPFGLVFWESTIVTLFLGAVSLLRGRRILPRPGAWRICFAVAFLGAIGPGWAYYTAAQHLPGGVLALLLSSVPMLAFPIALAMGNDSFGLLRLFGLICGMAGIVLLTGPDASLPDPAMAAFIPLALIAPLCYACEGNVVARWGTGGLDPIQVVTGASLLASLAMAPAAVLTGQWIDPLPPWGVPDLALLINALTHALVYAVYVWMVGRAGSVFAAQVSYLVTGFGMVWSMVLLAERYTGLIWLTLALMLTGIFLVQPRPRIRLAPVAGIGETGPPDQRGGPS